MGKKYSFLRCSLGSSGVPAAVIGCVALTLLSLKEDGRQFKRKTGQLSHFFFSTFMIKVIPGLSAALSPSLVNRLYGEPFWARSRTSFNANRSFSDPALPGPGISPCEPRPTN